MRFPDVLHHAFLLYVEGSSARVTGAGPSGEFCLKLIFTGRQGAPVLDHRRRGRRGGVAALMEVLGEGDEQRTSPHAGDTFSGLSGVRGAADYECGPFRCLITAI